MTQDDRWLPDNNAPPPDRTYVDRRPAPRRPSRMVEADEIAEFIDREFKPKKRNQQPKPETKPVEEPLPEGQFGDEEQET